MTTDLNYCDHIDELGYNEGYWVNDAQGIPLCKVCDRCRSVKLSRYRPEILSGYSQDDVSEPIEPEE